MNSKKYTKNTTTPHLHNIHFLPRVFFFFLYLCYLIVQQNEMEYIKNERIALLLFYSFLILSLAPFSPAVISIQLCLSFEPLLRQMQTRKEFLFPTNGNDEAKRKKKTHTHTQEITKKRTTSRSKWENIKGTASTERARSKGTKRKVQKKIRRK